MIVFQLKTKEKEPTRQEMLDFIKQEHVIRPVTIEEAKDFIRKKYGNRKWVDYLFAEVGFGYENVSSNTFGHFDKEQRKIMLPEWTIRVDLLELDLKDEQPYEEFSSILKSKDFDHASDKLLGFLYDEMQKEKKNLDGQQIEALEIIDHEIGHVILWKIQQNNHLFGMSYDEIEKYVIDRMKNSKPIAIAILKSYALGVYTKSSDSEMLQHLDDMFFNLIPDAKTIHPGADKILKKMLSDYYDLTSVDADIYEPRRDGQLEIREETWDRLKKYLSKDEVDQLKRDSKNIMDLDGKFGLKININKFGTHITIHISFSEGRKRIMEEFNLTKEQFQRLSDLRLKILQRNMLVDECFARLVDSLADSITKEDPKQYMLGITAKDLDFFSKLTFDGELMYEQEIETLRKKLGGKVPIKLK